MTRAIAETEQSRSEYRVTTPDEITTYFEKHFDNEVRVEFPPTGNLITVEEDWHGAGKEGEVRVHVGKLLTEPIAGTEIKPYDFTTWATNEGFEIYNQGNYKMPALPASTILSGNDYSFRRGEPLIRFTKNDGKSTPIEIQFYAGAENQFIQTLSEIGNHDARLLSDSDRQMYRSMVQLLFRPFITKGFKDIRQRLGLGKDTDIVRKIDDCAASYVTLMADQILDDRMQAPTDLLLESIEVSVASLQAVVLAISMAQRRHVPLVMRIGAPAFALGKQDGLNFLMNTSLNMTAHGKKVVGDMGKLMDLGDSDAQFPNLHEVRTDEISREIRLFLGGGRWVENVIEEEYRRSGKPMLWDILIRRAARIDKGPDHWAVLLSGTNLVVRPTRRDKLFLSAGTEILNNADEHHYVKQPGMWVSLGEKQSGRQQILFLDGKTLIDYFHVNTP